MSTIKQSDLDLKFTSKIAMIARKIKTNQINLKSYPSAHMLSPT